MKHRCQRECVCTRHDEPTPLIYHPKSGEHSCSDRDCANAQGMTYERRCAPMPDAPVCPCACCTDALHRLAHGREPMGCWCDGHPPEERCDCLPCLFASLARGIQVGELPEASVVPPEKEHR